MVLRTADKCCSPTHRDMDKAVTTAKLQSLLKCLMTLKLTTLVTDLLLQILDPTSDTCSPH